MIEIDLPLPVGCVPIPQPLLQANLTDIAEKFVQALKAQKETIPD